MAVITANTGSNNWNTNGAWVGGVQPSATSDVVIPASAVVTIPTGTTVLGRSLTVQASGTLAFASTTAVLTLGDATAGAGNVAVSISSSATITLTGIGTINYISTSTTQQTITTGGKTMPSQTVNGVGSSYLFSDNHTTTGAITLTSGTLNMNGKTVSARTLSFTGSTARTLTLGAANITLTFAGEALTATLATNLTFNVNTASITLSGAGASMRYTTTTFYNVTYTGGGAMKLNNGGNPGTFNNLTVTGTAAKTDTFNWDANGGTTINGALTLAGNSTTNRLLIQSSAPGTARTAILGASATFRTAGTQNVDFQDFSISGGASNERDLSGITGGAGNALGNSGITFTAATTRYAVVAGNWSSTTMWSTSSGGAGGASVPLPQDSVILNAGSAAGTYAADMPRLGADISWVGFTRTWTISTITCSMYGNLTLGAGMASWGGSQTLNLSGRGSQTITSNGFVPAQGVSWNIVAPGGSYTLQDDYAPITGRTLTFTYGIFNANDFNITLDNVTVQASMTAVNMGSGIWKITKTAAGTVWSWSAGATSIVQCQTSTIKWVNAPTGTQTFNGFGGTYYILDMTTAGSTGTLVISGSNTFTTINFSDAANARTLQFTAGTTTTVTNFNVDGTAGKLMSVQSVTVATHTLTSPSGTISCDYLSLTNSIATGGASWYAGANSTNVSGNTGWIFSAAPSSQGNFFQFF